MKYAILAVLMLVVVAACTQQQKQQTQPVSDAALDLSESDTVPKEGCYLMKHVRAGVYDCFGCSNNACREPNAKDWSQTDQSVPQARGYRCIASPRGCVVA